MVPASCWRAPRGLVAAARDENPSSQPGRLLHTIESMTTFLDNIRTSYDTVASSYAEVVQGPAGGEDEALDLIGEKLSGPILDAGCGPGRLAGRLHARGVRVFGMDLSQAMVDIARRDHPEIGFAVASVTALPVFTGSLAGVIAWWSLIHLPRDVLPEALGGSTVPLRLGRSSYSGFMPAKAAFTRHPGTAGIR